MLATFLLLLSGSLAWGKVDEKCLWDRKGLDSFPKMPLKSMKREKSQNGLVSAVMRPKTWKYWGGDQKFGLEVTTGGTPRHASLQTIWLVIRVHVCCLNAAHEERDLETWLII